MAYLINRNAASRLQCLHSICKFINTKFGEGHSFRLSDIKFDSNSVNVHQYCDYLIVNNSLGISHCRYKAPLDESGCGLTNSIDIDSTKSKEVSNTVNSLHGLGLVTRGTGNLVKLTKLGKKFASTDFKSSSMNRIIKEAVLNYGPMVGLIGQIINLKSDQFDSSDLLVGYPSAEERVLFNGRNILLSSGSERDSNTRTRSCLLAWGTTAGFFRPIEIPEYSSSNSHLGSQEYILSDSRNLRKYQVIELPEVNDSSFLVNRTLDYSQLAKNSKALRENNQSNIREATMLFDSKIKNRRFAILYLISTNDSISFKRIIDFMLKRTDLYVVDPTDLERVIAIEFDITNSAGLLCSVARDTIKKSNAINLAELECNAPSNVLHDLKSRRA